MWDRHFDRVRQMFADQFEPNDQGYIYRKYIKGAPIQVSRVERDRYVAAFNNYIRYSSWGIGGGMIVLTVLLVSYATATGFELPDMAMYLGLGAIFAAFMAGYYWNWNLPARDLRERLPIGQPRSREEIKQLFLSKLSYGQLAAAGGAGIFFLLKAYSNGLSFSGWSIFWASFGVAALISSAIQAFRKWRQESLLR